MQWALVKWNEIFKINKYHFSGSIKNCTWYYTDDEICKDALCLIDLFFKLSNSLHENRGYEYVSAIFFIIECFGAAGPHCSMPFNNNYFGYQCQHSSDCQNHEICNKYFGCLSII